MSSIVSKATRLCVVAAVCMAATGCATNEKIATNQLGDEKLSCQDIKSQDKKLDTVMEEASHNKGASGANVAAVLFFWPAAVGNYMDADKAEQLVNKRKAILADLYKEKRCNV